MSESSAARFRSEGLLWRQDEPGLWETTLGGALIQLRREGDSDFSLAWYPGMSATGVPLVFETGTEMSEVGQLWRKVEMDAALVEQARAEEEGSDG